LSKSILLTSWGWNWIQITPTKRNSVRPLCYPQIVWQASRLFFLWESLRDRKLLFSFFYPDLLSYRVLTGPGNPEKSWNSILAFSRTGKSWKINARPGKSWKSINSCRKVSFDNNCLQYYFWISISQGFISSITVHLGDLEKSESWTSLGKLFLKKGTNPILDIILEW